MAAVAALPLHTATQRASLQRWRSRRRGPPSVVGGARSAWGAVYWRAARAPLLWVLLFSLALSLPGGQSAAAAVAGSGDDDVGDGESGDLAGDAWMQLTTEEWQPGRAGEGTTKVPMKDLECLGPQAKLVSNWSAEAGIDWTVVKEALHAQRSRPDENQWLFSVAARIQRDEPDTCVLGITSTSAFLLPMTMPKFRNMARMLNTDTNFLVLNVTFYDAVRSGFPIFGILDGLSTDAFRDWFFTPESFEYMPERSRDAAEEATTGGCDTPVARRLREAIARARAGEADAAASGGSGSGVPVSAGIAFLAAGAAGSGLSAEVRCPQAAVAALLVSALARAELAAGAAVGEAALLALRDVVELVSRAERLLRRLSWDNGVGFGELVASPWSPWWLLHRLQLALPALLRRCSSGDSASLGLDATAAAAASE
eukprot:TRINITY_DN20619_c0_g7_i1.p1 TRINITY_DN20619_c0_g7~~TRINITY_DN20619_c0_g7_i1.p1  ORF type:complete len:427 (+),score=112.00 TRINITY_DN20619_c0_g7_i1:82-1362(+)